MSHTTHPGLDALWLTEAVRLREEQAGPLEDSEAVRQALARSMGQVRQGMLGQQSETDQTA
ncbi:hypothetical protein EIM20_16205, partial [Pseudomonas aeruginosa]